MSFDGFFIHLRLDRENSFHDMLKKKRYAYL